MGLMPDTPTTTQVWATVFSDETRSSTLEASAVLRKAGVRVQVSTRVGKIGKQFKDASHRGVPYVLLCGPDEAAAGTVTLKNLATGEQHTAEPAQIASMLGV